MNLDIINNIVNDVKNNKFIDEFIKELQNYIDTKKEDIKLPDSETKLNTMYRDKLLVERSNILNKYAEQTIDRGDMYYIYDTNSKMINGYNLCVCKEGMSHIVIEANKELLPKGSNIGSVLRKKGNEYVLDEEATIYIGNEIENIKKEIIEEQKEYLESKRIEGHVYEMSENNGESVWLFDITNNSSEGIEEMNFPNDLLENSEEGDLFIYRNGEYEKYSK